MIPFRHLLLLAALAATPAWADDASSAPAQLPAHPIVQWTGGLGISSPFIFSFTGGAIVPLGRRQAPPGEPPGVPALHLDADAGLGGAMISGGFSIPVAGGSAIVFKRALLQTWLFDIGPGKDRAYTGTILEMRTPTGQFTPNTFSLGYFRGYDAASQGKHFLYAFAGFKFAFP